MGASGWEYFVPYQQDINKALQELRQKAFDGGDYYKRESAYEFKQLTEEQIIKRYEGYEGSDWMIDDALHERSLPEPTDPDSLLIWNREAGAHSIIDMARISDTPDFNAAAPLSEEALLELFGTTKPNHGQVVAKKTAISDLRERWYGTYIIVYKDDEQDELFFTGFSGD